MAYRAPNSNNGRIPLYRVNWANGVNQTITFKTDVITAGDGWEQRRAVSPDGQRCSYEYQSIFKGDDKRAFDRFCMVGMINPAIVDSRNDNRFVPDFRSYGILTDKFYIFRDIPAENATIIEAPIEVTEYSVINYGFQPITLSAYNYTEAHRKCEFINKNGSWFVQVWIELQFGDERLRDANDTIARFNIGDRVFGTIGNSKYIARMVSDRLTDDVVTVNWTIEFEGAVPRLDTSPFPVHRYRDVDYRVMTIKHNYREAINVEVLDELDEMDSGYGTTTSWRRYKFPSMTWKMSYMMAYDRIDTLIQHFCDMQGRLGEFFLPTFETDIPIEGLPEEPSNLITVEGIGFAEAYRKSFLHKFICIFYSDGEIFTARVEGIGSDIDTQLSTLILDADIPARDWPVDRISWMYRVRFGSDRLEVMWDTLAATETGVTYVTLPALDRVIEIKGSSMLSAFTSDGKIAPKPIDVEAKATISPFQSEGRIRVIYRYLDIDLREPAVVLAQTLPITATTKGAAQ